MTSTLLLPTLCEAEGLRLMMPRVRREWFDQILIVDANSRDGTEEFAAEHGYEFMAQKDYGLRQAYAEAYPRIRGEVVVTMSPDGNCLPERIPDLLAKMREGYDMVIVSRYLDGAKSEDDDLLTAFGNRLFTGTVNALFGGRYTDAMGIFRAWRRDVFERVGLGLEATYAFEERLFRTRISIEPILSARAAKRGLRIGEIPGDEPRRLKGQRKLQVFRWGAAYITQFAREALSFET